jgi:hypothetical protein
LLSGWNRFALWEQEVAREARFHICLIADATEVAHLF